MHTLFLIILGCLVLFTGGCSKVIDHQTAELPGANELQTTRLTEQQRVMALSNYYALWAGTNYRMGGEGRNGIDCSAFVQQVYAELFSIGLPRTTAAQARAGERIALTDLRPTDLVFFRTSMFGKHVGIYHGEDSFLHVSTENGVMISSLHETYWRTRFWQARRIIQP